MRLTTLLTTAALAAFSSLASAEIKIGMITTLSGGGSSLGIDVRDGFMLAVELSGRTDMTVLIEDDGRSVDTAVALADRMMGQDNVDVLTGIIWSNLALAVVPKVVEQDVFYLSPNAGPSAFAGEGCHANYFNVAWQNDNLHEAAAPYANKLEYRRTFIMAPDYAAGKDALRGFKRFYEGEPAGEIYTELGQTDYAAELQQISASGADSVYFFLPGGMGINFLKQYEASGMDLPVIGPAFSFDQGILQAVGASALGIVNFSQWSNDLGNLANVTFVEAFEAKYGRLPSLYASQGYDTANLIISAMERADVSDMDAFRSALKRADFKSTRGDFKFGRNHHPIQNIYAREVVQIGDVITNKTVGTGAIGHRDAYGIDCPL